MDLTLEQPEQTRPQRLAGIAGALGLLAVAVWMLTTFLPALAWATVLAIATWPLFVGPALLAVLITLWRELAEG